MVMVTAKAAQRLRRLHPWVYRQDVLEPPKTEEARRYLESIVDEFPQSPEAKRAQARLKEFKPAVDESAAAPAKTKKKKTP